MSASRPPRSGVDGRPRPRPPPSSYPRLEYALVRGCGQAARFECASIARFLCGRVRCVPLGVRERGLVTHRPVLQRLDVLALVLTTIARGPRLLRPAWSDDPTRRGAAPGRTLGCTRPPRGR